MRKIYMAGMNHKVAEIAVREKFYIPMDVKTEALKNNPFDELLILATCNRTEVYVASDRTLEQDELVRYVCDLAHQKYEDFVQFFYCSEGDAVVRHVMNVCAGLDSVAVGEDQILHQIGRAYETAHQHGTTGNSLNKLFQSAIHTTKRIKTETNLSKLSCNIPFLAMKQVQKTFDDLENRSVYIVGLGEMGSLMLKYVQENTTKIFASSRTFANAEKFGDVLTPVPFENRYSVMGKADVMILCSACQEPIVTKSEYKKNVMPTQVGIGCSNKQLERNRLVIDLGSPRNAEASIGELPGVQYVCVDDLEKIVSENRRLRMIELEAAQRILQEGIEEFLQWYRMDDVAKQINIHASQMVSTAEEECEKLLRSMPDLSAEDSERIRMMYVRFAKKMANDYLYKVKAENSAEDVKIFLDCLDKVMLTKTGMTGVK
ncbi:MULTISPECIES: glutamyl-tRNA reductase [unclassified Fibrobacter]|uniref:glutamyl-tRNA reductase n=1 Tax=unclassified Fibrobacter TaxID=2634177 RepID=UPI000D6CE6EA|nr:MULTISPECIES: glutamyl-tRNA reductase [unclassified Fibrobacter]PWJ69964.1 glutamyl-tRNA reductase [Fibrobacter sp. UWR4]PZW73135.1 glutamyl-tRNA reductase [Fibrobacter sp. UWR1]